MRLVKQCVPLTFCSRNKWEDIIWSRLDLMSAWLSDAVSRHSFFRASRPAVSFSSTNVWVACTVYTYEQMCVFVCMYVCYCATERLKADAKTATHNLLEHGVKDNSVVVQRYLLSDNSLNSDKLGSILRRSDWYGIRLYQFERKKKSWSSL